MFGGRLWVPLRSLDYRRLWFGQTVSVIGDKVDQIALGILVYQLTGSELQMGVMLAISMLPAALLGMPAGAVVDRWDRRRTMIAADLVRALLVFSVPFAVGVGLWLVYLIAFAVATVSLFFEPAKLALIPEIVGADELMAANSLDSATVSAAELAGLAFAGGLVAALGYRAAFFLDAVTYLLSAFFIWRISHRAAPRLVPAAGLREIARDAAGGMRYVFQHPVLRDLLAVYATASAGIAGSVTLVYVLALQHFKGGAPGLATLDAAITVGLLLGSFAVGRADPSGAGRKLLGGLLVYAGLYALTAAAPTLLVAAAILLTVGVANMFFYVPIATILQTVAAPDMRGRAFAAKQALSRILSVAGFIGAGALAEKVGLHASILLVSALVAVAALVGLSRPKLRSV